MSEAYIQPSWDVTYHNNETGEEKTIRVGAEGRMEAINTASPQIESGPWYFKDAKKLPPPRANSEPLSAKPLSDERAAQLTQQDRTWNTAYEFMNVGEKALVDSMYRAACGLMREWGVTPDLGTPSCALLGALARFVVVSRG